MSEDTAVKLKPFSGKEDEWVYWAPMFLARAEAKGYREILGEAIDSASAASADSLSSPIYFPNSLLLNQIKLNCMSYCLIYYIT